jgi:hypothetical protein
MTVKELIEMLKTCDEESKVNSINANGLYVIRKAGSNRAGFIKFND